jgi:hypothetical protein
MSDSHINIFASAEDGGYVADRPDLGCCSAFCATPESPSPAAQASPPFQPHGGSYPTQLS